ncbi:MAG TPA: glycosyltransferase family 2 protein [Candidatus Bathyarchaeia archaeon]|nr:glycosyltransferase family 2 protein [Candidatus Bathyarchaeia archaeon]
MINKAKTKLVTVIIPNWNGEQLLDNCLKSLMDQWFQDFNIIVVDNGSIDGSLRLINSRYPTVRTIVNRNNLGFAKAVNQGISVSRSKYIILLNNDTVVEKNFIQTLVESIRRSNKICAVAAKILNYNNPNIIDSAGDVINSVGQAFHRGNGDDTSKWNIREKVFLITACASIYKANCFKKIGLFDEDFFAYGEDVDWCLRAQLIGCEFWFEPKAIVFHHNKATSKRISRSVEYLQFRNMTFSIIKNFPIGLLLKRWRFITIPMVHLNTLLYMSMRGFWKEAFMADIWLLKNAKKIIAKRITILGQRKTSIDSFNQHMVYKKIRCFGLVK